MYYRLQCSVLLILFVFAYPAAVSTGTTMAHRNTPLECPAAMCDRQITCNDPHKLALPSLNYSKYVKIPHSSSLQVIGFSWKSCGDDTNPVKLTSLSGFINGTILSLTGTAKVAIDLASPVQAEVEMKKKFFWGWSLIPCVKDFGSCTYEDICTMSYPDTEVCPKDFVVNQLPCRCPVPQGQYAAKDFHVNLNILPQWIEKGSYKVKVNLKKDSEQMICIIMSETL